MGVEYIVLVHVPGLYALVRISSSTLIKELGRDRYGYQAQVARFLLPTGDNDNVIGITPRNISNRFGKCGRQKAIPKFSQLVEQFLYAEIVFSEPCRQPPAPIIWQLSDPVLLVKDRQRSTSQTGALSASRTSSLFWDVSVRFTASHGIAPRSTCKLAMVYE